MKIVTSTEMFSMSGHFRCLLLIDLSWRLASTYPQFQRQIPNGASVPFPCSNSETWPGVGHELLAGDGKLNPFGLDFLANGYKWDVALCSKDSDGDGLTNGEELGDPECRWEPGLAPDNVTGLSHPGICEPITSPVCSNQTEFLKQFEECAATLLNEQCPELDSVPSISLRFNETLLPSDSGYYCQTFQVPHDADYHIVAWEPIISREAQAVTRRLTLYICDSLEEEAALEQSGLYRTPSHCPMIPDMCQGSSISWANGLDRRCYDRHAGVPMGKSHYKKVILQIHYNNPKRLSGLHDSSGIRLYYTATKRPVDIGSLEVGQIDIAIPPRSRQRTRITSRTFQTTQCSLNSLRPYEAYNITSVMFHMQKLGVHAKLTLKKRNGHVVTLIDEAVTYDRPRQIVWPSSSSPVVLEPGDNFETECIFQSPDESDWTFFGEETTDEMCLAYLEIHPRPQGKVSMSLANLGKLDICSMERFTVSGCQVEVFREALMEWEMSPIGGLMTYCNDPALGYPAYSCTYSCYVFLAQKNVFGHPCLKGTTFHLAATYVISDKMADIYRIRSQVERCSSLDQAPQQSVKDEIVLVTLTKSTESPRTTKKAKSSDFLALQNLTTRHKANNNLFTVLLVLYCLCY